MLLKLLRKLGTSPQITLKDLGTNPQLNFVVTSDFYRADIGVILCRRPIFYDISETEFEKIKREHILKTKYDLYAPLTKELTDFDRTDIEKASDTIDELPSHFRRTSGGKTVLYKPNSKYWKNVNPSQLEPHNIQSYSLYNVYYLIKRNGKWGFPETEGRMDQSFTVSKEGLINELNGGEFKVLFTSKYPMCIRRSILTNEETAVNPYYAKCVGKKTFFYQAFHDTGATNNVYQKCEDFAWVPKPLMNKYLSESDFEFFMPFLKETDN